MKLQNPRLAWIGGGLAVLALVIAAKLIFFPAKPKAEMAVAPVTRGAIEQTVMATGTLEPVTLVSVGAQVSGQLTSLKVELGQTVRKGELIAEIDSQPQQNALATAQAQLANVKAQRQEAAASLAQAQLAFQRQSTMLAADATSRADYEAAQASFKAAQAQLASLEAQINQAEVSVRTAQVNLGYTRIVSPIDGTVVAIVTKQGQTVNANQSAPTIVKVGQLGTMTVEAEISEADVIKVRPGQEVYFTVLGAPDRRYTATLRAVEPAPDSLATETTSSSSSSTSSSSTAVYYNGLFDVPNTDGDLRTSMTAQVSIVLAKADNALLVPASALQDKRPDGLWRVMVAARPGARPEPRWVKVGINNNVQAQVLSGLSEGEQVVVAEAASGAAAGATQGPPPGGQGGRRPPSPLGF